VKREEFFSLCVLGTDTKSWPEVKQWKVRLDAGKIFSIIVMVRPGAGSPGKLCNLIYWRIVGRGYTNIPVSDSGLSGSAWRRVMNYRIFQGPFQIYFVFLN